MDDVETQAALEPDEAAQAAALVILLANERAADIAETLNEESPAVAAAVLMGLPKDHAIEILDQPILDSGSEIVSLMPRETAADLLHGVSADRVADLCRKLEEPHRTELLDRLDPDTRVMILRLLSYPSHSAGSIMTTEFASACRLTSPCNKLSIISARSNPRERRCMRSMFSIPSPRIWCRRSPCVG
jgi:magnesium transporter